MDNFFFMNILKKILILLIDIYKNAISPYLGHHCRFDPTCSQFAKIQIQTRPLPIALGKSAWRILCCWPLGDYLIKFEHFLYKKFNGAKK